MSEAPTLELDADSPPTELEGKPFVPTLAFRPAYAPLLHCHDPFLFVEGPRGTAKTTAELMVMVLRALQFPGSRIFLMRYNRTELTQSVLVTLEETVFPMFGMSVPGRQARTQRSEYVLPNSTVIVPLGGADQGRLLSSEWTTGYLAEAVHWPKNLVIDLAGCMRYIRGPGKRANLPDWSQVILDANPHAPDHWLNVLAEDVPDDVRRVRSKKDYWRLQEHNWRKASDPIHRWKRIVTKHQDNPGYWDFGAWDWTPLGRKYVTETLEILSGSQRKRWLDGLWTAAEGVVFPEWDESLLVVDDFPEGSPPAEWPQIIAYDPGWGTTAVLWLALSPDGGIWAYDEIYEGEKSMEAHCNEINQRNKTYNRNIIRAFADPNEAFSNRAQNVSCAAQAKQYGIRFSPWPADKGSAFDAGVEAIRHLIANGLKSHPVAPYLRVCKRCKGLRSNMANWSYVRDKDGNAVEGADRYEKGNDHALDCLRGAVQSGFLQKMFTRNMQEST